MLPGYGSEITVEEIGPIRNDVINFLRGRPYGNEAAIDIFAGFEITLYTRITEFSVITNDFELLDTLVMCRPGEINHILERVTVRVKETTMLEHLLEKFNPPIHLNLLTVAIFTTGSNRAQEFTEVLFAYHGIDELKSLLSTCEKNKGPFYAAISSRKYNVVNRLLELGFEPSLENGTLAVASYRGCPSVLDQLVVYGVDINRPFRKYTYLHIAAWNRDRKRVKQIINRGANTVIMDPYRRVALILWYHQNFTSCPETEEQYPDYEKLAAAIPCETRLTGRASNDWRYIESMSVEPAERYFTREMLDQIPEPPRELFDHTPAEYVSAFLEYETRPYARLLVDYILSKY